MPSSFQQSVQNIVSKIPKGKVATYKQVALLAGSPKAVRAVGMCMSRNTDTLKIPCHRVVASNGNLTGYAFGGTESKKEKLLSEGVKFKGNTVLLSESQWKITSLS